MEWLFGAVFAALVSFKRFYMIQAIHVNAIYLKGRNFGKFAKFVKNSPN